MSRYAAADSNSTVPFSQRGEPLFETLVVVGVGLLGGSVGLAAKQSGAVRRVIGVGRNAARLAEARAANVIDEFNLELRSAAARAALIVFATPVDLIVPGVREAASAARPGTLITDVGSTKARICRELSSGLPDGVTFVGSHPLAGSHQQGWENARADLLAGRVCVVTNVTPPAPPFEGGENAVSSQAGNKGISPPCEGGARKGSLIADFWQSLGMRVIEMSPEAHDRAVAQTSHVPHVVASALARTLTESNRELASTGFADTTRIAAGDALVWVPILLDNADALSESLDGFARELSAFREALARRDAQALRTLWDNGKTARDAIPVARNGE